MPRIGNSAGALTVGAAVFTPSDGAAVQVAEAVAAYVQNINSVGSAGQAFRQRGTTTDTFLASAARTVATQSAAAVNHNCRGAHVTLSVTAASGTGGLQATLQGQDPISGNWYNLNALPTAVIATGLTVYEIYPGVGAASGGVTQRTSGAVPNAFRVNVAVGDATSYTYSVAVSLIP